MYEDENTKNQIRDLSRIQRRVVGVLMEKAFTTPDQYPLTLKATTTGCNQKSNRNPTVSYSEDQVQDTLDQLREMSLVAEVFTDGGRAPRYRHYMRQNFDFTENQFAIIAELLLRGRQQPGELRTRASRMSKIEGQDQLREALIALQEKGYLQSNGPLERRGVEVDHTFYLVKEGMNLSVTSADAVTPTEVSSSVAASSPEITPATADERVGISAEQIESLRTMIAQQADTINGLESVISELDERLQRLERDLGV